MWFLFLFLLLLLLFCIKQSYVLAEIHLDWSLEQHVSLPSHIIAEYTERLLRLPKPQTVDGSDCPKVPKGTWCDWDLVKLPYSIFRMLPQKDCKCKHGQSAKVQLQHVNRCKICENVACAILGLCLKEALTRDLWWGMLKIDGSKGATLVSPWNVAMAHISSHQVLSLPKIR